MDYRILNARDFGLPQNRKRMFIVAMDKAKGGFGNFKFPSPIPLTYTLSDIVGGKCEREFSRTLICAGRGIKLTRPPNKWGCDVIVKDGMPYRLSVRENLRLQGFPEDFVPHKARSHALRQVGNAVPPPMIYALVKPILTVRIPT